MGQKAQGEALPREGVKALRSAAEDLKALDAMNLKQLQAKFLLLYGVETHSKNPTFLRRKLAWKIQEARDGGLSEEAKARLESLKPTSLPVKGPKTIQVPPEALSEALLQTALKDEGPRHLRDARIPIVGTLLRRSFHGTDYEVTVEAEGFRYQGALFRSLSAVARVITGTSWNGFVFFGLTERP